MVFVYNTGINQNSRKLDGEGNTKTFIVNP